jgi:hypothetical protein
MPHEVKAVQPRQGHTLALRFEDDAAFELDFAPLVKRQLGSELIDPLQDVQVFQKVQIDYGTIVFPTGYDICPDVLRYWCELGRIASEKETDAFFLQQYAVKADV